MSSASSKTGSASTSSAAWTISAVLPNSVASSSIASSESVCVSVAISPSAISLLMISGDRHVEVLGDVLDGRAGVDADVRGAARLARLERGRLLVGAAAAPAAALAARRLVGAAARDRLRPVRGARPASRSRRGGGRRPRRGCARPAASRASGAASARRPIAVRLGSRRPGGAAVAGAPFWPSALSARASSTVAEGAAASMPAACSLSRRSLTDIPCSFAMSLTRFLLIPRPSVRSRRWPARSPRAGTRG